MPSRARPLVGVSADLAARPSTLDPDRRVLSVDMAYARCVLEAGGLPLVIPPLADAGSGLDLAHLLDGLILTGGDGLPARLDGPQGELPPDLPPVLPQRLAAELALYRALRAAGRPVLGICLGMQLMNLEAGGTLAMDVARDCPGALGHSSRRGREAHPLHLSPGCELQQWCLAAAHEPSGPGPYVNSSHLQAVQQVGHGFEPCAWSDDGVIEAIRPSTGLAAAWLLGVQWHPERQSGPLGHGLVQRFVQHCARRSGRSPLD